MKPRAAKTLPGAALRVHGSPGVQDMLKAEIPGQELVITQHVHSGMYPPPALGARLRC